MKTDFGKSAETLGAKDGRAAKARFEKSGRRYDGLAAAHAAARGHFRRMDRGELLPKDAVDYGTAFLNACIGSEE